MAGIVDRNTLVLAVEGYPSSQSYRPGETVAMCCSARVPTFSAEVSRVGGSRDVVWRLAGIVGAKQPVPERAYEVGCGWSPTFTIPIGEDWRSGFYEVSLRADGVDGPEAVSQAFFAVRSARPGVDASILAVLATNTYNAYNMWGGACHEASTYDN